MANISDTTLYITIDPEKKLTPEHFNILKDFIAAQLYRKAWSYAYNLTSEHAYLIHNYATQGEELTMTAQGRWSFNWEYAADQLSDTLTMVSTIEALNNLNKSQHSMSSDNTIQELLDQYPTTFHQAIPDKYLSYHQNLQIENTIMDYYINHYLETVIYPMIKSDLHDNTDEYTLIDMTGVDVELGADFIVSDAYVKVIFDLEDKTIRSEYYDGDAQSVDRDAMIQYVNSDMLTTEEVIQKLEELFEIDQHPDQKDKWIEIKKELEDIFETNYFDEETDTDVLNDIITYDLSSTFTENEEMLNYLGDLQDRIQ